MPARGRDARAATSSPQLLRQPAGLHLPARRPLRDRLRRARRRDHALGRLGADLAARARRLGGARHDRGRGCSYLAGARLFDRRTGLLAAAAAGGRVPAGLLRQARAQRRAGAASASACRCGAPPASCATGAGATTRSRASGSGSPRRPSTPAGSSRCRCSRRARALGRRRAAPGARSGCRWPACSRSPPSSPPTPTRWPTGTAFTNGIAHQSSESAAGTGKLGLTHGSGIVYYLWSLTWGVGWVPGARARSAALALLARADRRAFVALLVPALVVLPRLHGPAGPLLRALGDAGDPDRLPARRLRRADRGESPRAAAARGERRRSRSRAVALCAQGGVDSVHSGIVNSRVDTRTLDARLARRARSGAHADRRRADRARQALGAGDCGRLTRSAARTRRRADGAARVRAGKPVSLENYERTLSPALVALYERSGYCWVVTGSTEEGRALVDPTRRAGGGRLLPRARRAGGTLRLRGSPYAPGAAPVAFNFDWSFDYYPAAYARPGPLRRSVCTAALRQPAALRVARSPATC